MYNHYLSMCFEIGSRRGLEDEKTITAYQLLEVYEKTESTDIGKFIECIYNEVVNSL